MVWWCGVERGMGIEMERCGCVLRTENGVDVDDGDDLINESAPVGNRLAQTDGLSSIHSRITDSRRWRILHVRSIKSSSESL